MSGNSSKIYDAKFFEQTEKGSVVAAREILRRISYIRPFSSVIDIGCGVGAWLRVAQEIGAVRVLGLDGAYVPRDELLISEDCFLSQDLEEPFAVLERFDVALCLEVAEHVSVQRGASLVADLVAASEFVVFSAAIPYQGGDGHLNEMWPTYWADLFAQQGYKPWDGIRSDIWNLREVPWWYRQNLLIFVADSSWQRLLGDRPSTVRGALNRVHPECYLYAARRAKVQFATSYSTDVDILLDSEAGIHNPPGYGAEFGAPLIYGRE